MKDNNGWEIERVARRSIRCSLNPLSSLPQLNQRPSPCDYKGDKQLSMPGKDMTMKRRWFVLLVSLALVVGVIGVAAGGGNAGSADRRDYLLFARQPCP